MVDVLKSKDLEEKKKYFIKVRSVRDEMHHAGAAFLLGVKKNKYNFEKDKKIIDKIKFHMEQSENLIHKLLQRMQTSLK